jgi:hypothetical protein
VADQEYTNRFADVHKKVKAFKDRVREINKIDAELRASRSVQEEEEMLARRKPSGTASQRNLRRSA